MIGILSIRVAIASFGTFDLKLTLRTMLRDKNKQSADSQSQDFEIFLTMSPAIIAKWLILKQIRSTR